MRQGSRTRTRTHNGRLDKHSRGESGNITGHIGEDELKVQLKSDSCIYT